MLLATLINADLQCCCSWSLRRAYNALNHGHSTHSLSLNSTGHLMDLHCVLLARACAARHLGDTRLLTWAPLALGSCATPDAHILLQTTTDAYHGLHDACASGNVGQYLAISRFLDWSGCHDARHPRPVLHSSQSVPARPTLSSSARSRVPLFFLPDTPLPRTIAHTRVRRSPTNPISPPPDLIYAVVGSVRRAGPLLAAYGPDSQQWRVRPLHTVFLIACELAASWCGS